MNAFVPSDYVDFGRSSISSGENFTRQTGHGIRNLQDVRDVLVDSMADSSRAATETLSAEGRDLCVLAALLLDDRVQYRLRHD